MRARLRALQSVELRTLDDADLRLHHSDVLRVLAEGFRIHFRNALAHWIGVGDWLANTNEWTGTPPEEALHALEGASPFSVDALAYLDRIAAAVKAAPDALEVLTATGDPGARLARLRASSPAVDAAVSEYLDEHGWRIFTGFDVMDQAIVEMPESVLRSIASRLAPPATSDRGPRFAAALRSKVPPQPRGRLRRAVRNSAPALRRAGRRRRHDRALDDGPGEAVAARSRSTAGGAGRNRRTATSCSMRRSRKSMRWLAVPARELRAQSSLRGQLFGPRTRRTCRLHVSGRMRVHHHRTTGCLRQWPESTVH